MHRFPSEGVPFVYLASVCRSLQCLISALTQLGLLVPSRCGEGLVLLSPLRCSGSQRTVPALGCSTKARTKSCACFLCLPRQSGSGSQKLDGRTLSGCGAPSALRVPRPSPHPRQLGASALCLAMTLPADVDHPESEEVFNWKLEACLQCGRGCGPWGRACPFPLFLASSLRWGWAGL